MSGVPPITIGTPVFNGAAWIGETLESVLAQDYSGELEYIVLDDGSTDGTLDVLAPYAERGVRIVSHTNMGRGTHREPRCGNGQSRPVRGGERR